MTDKSAPRSKKVAIVLMCLAPILAFAPMIVAMIEVSISPECSAMPNYCGAIAYFILLTVPIGFVIFSVGLIMFLIARRPKKPAST
jgi:hypothetical protein